jgi:hypothetical protein
MKRLGTLAERHRRIFGVERTASARIKGCFVTASPARAKRLHLPVETCLAWTHRGVRLVVATACGAQLSDARPHIEAPSNVEMCDLCFLADFVKPCVYRLIDVDGFLLYIGCTANLAARVLAHQSQPYWPRVAVIDHVDHDDHAAALEAEEREIAFFQPPLNRDHTDRRARRGRRPVATLDRGAA